jgi:hypothetical protein
VIVTHTFFHCDLNPKGDIYRTALYDNLVQRPWLVSTSIGKICAILTWRSPPLWHRAASAQYTKIESNPERKTASFLFRATGFPGGS